MLAHACKVEEGQCAYAYNKRGEEVHAWCMGCMHCGQRSAHSEWKCNNACRGSQEKARMCTQRVMVQEFMYIGVARGQLAEGTSAELHAHACNVARGQCTCANSELWCRDERAFRFNVQ